MTEDEMIRVALRNGRSGVPPYRPEPGHEAISRDRVAYYLGSGNIARFARLTRRDPLVEGSVGEFMLGNPA